MDLTQITRETSKLKKIALMKLNWQKIAQYGYS